MTDSQKWQEAAAGIEQDIEYLKIALATYRRNAQLGVRWPEPNELFCIKPLPFGTNATTTIRRDLKSEC